MLHPILILLSLFSRVLIPIDGLKILAIFPQSYKSHITFNNAVMSSLAAAGHHITMISPFTEYSQENYTFIDTSNQTSLLMDAFTVSDLDIPGPSMSVYFLMFDEGRWCRMVMELLEMQDALKSKEKPYDLIFVETQTMYSCYYTILARKWKIPVIGTVTLYQWNYADYAISNLRNPAYVPDENASNYLHEKFFARLLNTINYLVRHFLWYYEVKPAREQFLRNYSQESTSTFEEIKPSLIFYNGHSSIFPRPMNPNAIEVAGVHTKEAKPLPQDLQKYVDESKHGVILFTLGSIVKSSSFSEETKQALLQAFAAIPQRVIWKFEEKLKNVPENVLLVKWLPQRDILAHNKTVAFISHCGLSGMYETIYEAVPVIAIPIFVDQHANAEIITRNGAAITLNKNSLTKENVLGALNAVINDTRYAENMKRLSRRFRDRPLSPQETIVYWTEYVHRHNGAPHLKTAAAELYWFQNLLLDVMLFVVSVAVLVIAILKFLLKKLMHCVCKSTMCVTKSKKSN